MWYAIKAWNEETLYGWTEDREVMEAAVARLNGGREVNCYAAEPLDLVAFGRDRWRQRAGIDDAEPAAEALEQLAEKTLDEWGGLVFTDDSTVADFATDDDDPTN